MSPRHPDAFDRLRRTATMARQAHARWSEAHLAVIGGGLLGGLFVPELARSGASCDVYDPGIAEGVNMGTQRHIDPGTAKVETLARYCNEIAPGSVRPHQIDVTHVGEGAFETVDLIVNCSDDPGLEFPLNRLGAGWGIPVLRMAVDGTGAAEMGRVLISHPGGGHACGICGLTWREAFDAGPRTPCLGPREEAAPTYAGSAVAMAVVGLGLLCAQRLVGGNGAERVLDREFLVDLDEPQILSMALARSEDCLTGHRRWDPVRVERDVCEVTVRELLELAAEELTRQHPEAPPTDLRSVRVGTPAHPILPAVMCTACGESGLDVGTSLRTLPCPSCGRLMERRRDITVGALTLEYAESLSVADRSCASLGFPRGTLVEARTTNTAAIHFLFP